MLTWVSMVTVMDLCVFQHVVLLIIPEEWTNQQTGFQMKVRSDSVGECDLLTSSLTVFCDCCTCRQVRAEWWVELMLQKGRGPGLCLCTGSSAMPVGLL